MKKAFSLIFAFSILLALSGCSKKIEINDEPYEPQSTKNPEVLQALDQPREYYRDTITLYIPHKNDPQLMDSAYETKPEFLEIDLNRRELVDQSGFQHYYFLEWEQEGRHFKDSIQFTDKSSRPQAQDFLKAWENELFEDLSSREIYNFEIDLGPGYKVELKDLQADFLTKNTPEFTRYTSAGRAIVTKDGTPLEAFAVLEKAYSTDDSLYLYFDGYEDLSNETNSMHLWDEDGIYYYLDQTKIIGKEPEGYKSHTWLLKKDLKANILQKSFTATVDFSENNKEWKIDMPDFGVNFDLTTNSEFQENPSSGMVTGTIRDSQGKEKKVTGWFTHYKP